MKRVGIWVRVSSDMQVEADSPEVHLFRAQDYCKEKGFEVVEIYRLDAVSGKAIWDLPIAQKMRYDIENGHIQALIFTDLERLGRNALELLQFEKHFKSHGAHLICIAGDEVIDTSTAEGAKRFQNRASDAEYFSAKLGEGVTRGIITRMRRGEVFGKAPYGYRKEKKMLYPDPVEAPVVELVFSLFLSGLSFSSIADELAKRGHKTRGDNPIEYYAVRRILTCTTVMGTHYQNRFVNKKKLKARDQWIEMPVEPIISLEDWVMANKAIDQLYQPKKRTLHAYSGLLRCYCNTPMYYRGSPTSGKPSYFCRSCHNRIKAHDLESAISEVIESFALDKLPAHARVDVVSEYQAKVRQLTGLKASLAEQYRKNDKLVELYMNEALTLDEFKTRKIPIINRLLAIEQEIAVLEHELSDTGGQALAERAIKTALTTLPWARTSEIQKNDLLKKIVREITLTRETIELQLLYVPATLNSNFVQ